MKFVEIFISNKILFLKNKNIENKCGSDTWVNVITKTHIFDKNIL